MGQRNRSAVRRELAADLKAWPAALLIVVVYLVATQGNQDAPEAKTDPGFGSFTEMEGQP